MPQLSDEILDPTVKAFLGLLDPPDPLDFAVPSLDFWRGDDFWTGVREGGGMPKVDSLASFDMDGWMHKYENGRIPSSAMAAVQGNMLMRPDAAAAYKSLAAAAKAAGVSLTIGNSYRTYAQQVAIDPDGNRRTAAGAPAAKWGTSNHGWGLAVDMQNMPKGTTSREHAWMAANAHKFGFKNPYGNSGDATEPWHWEYKGGYDGATPQSRAGSKGLRGSKGLLGKIKDALGGAKVDEASRAAGIARSTVNTQPQSVPGLPAQDPNSFANAIFELLQAPMLAAGAAQQAGQQQFTGDKAWIKSQLHKGFKDAGRGDLAKMVGTKAFDSWIAAESGWNPSIRGQGLGANRRVYGLFQFMDFDSRPWLQQSVKNGQLTATPYEQAQWVVKYFNLSVADIKGYANEIAAGTYQGWG